jgi:hypothetical protein
MMGRRLTNTTRKTRRRNRHPHGSPVRIENWRAIGESVRHRTDEMVGAALCCLYRTKPRPDYGPQGKVVRRIASSLGDFVVESRNGYAVHPRR